MAKTRIEMNNEKKPATIICPHCKKEILFDIRSFNDDISAIMRDDCPACQRQIFVGVMMLSHPNLQGLCMCIQSCIQALKPGNINLISKS